MFHRPDTHVIVVCPVHTRPSTESRALLTNQIRTCIKSLSQRCSNVVLPFLHTVHLISSSPDLDVLSTQQRAGVMTNFMRMSMGNVFVNVMESDAVSVLVGSDLPHTRPTSSRRNRSSARSSDCTAFACTVLTALQVAKVNSSKTAETQ